MSGSANKFMGEVQNALDSFAEKDRSFDCRRCGAHYVPDRGQWIFYQLCDACFARFDSQKMEGRFITMGMAPGDGRKRYEAVADWIAAETADPTKMG